MIVASPPKKAHKRQPKPRIARILTLTAATYQPATSVRLTFDRPVDIAALNVAAIGVDDGAINHIVLQGTGTPTLIDPQTVQIPLSTVTMSSATQVLLTASAATGISAVDDGGTWSGRTNLVLPFP